MNTYNTVPADSEAMLLAKPKTQTPLKTILGGAAVASFVLGCLAATATTGSVAPKTTSFDEQAIERQMAPQFTPTGNNYAIKSAADMTQCLDVSGAGKGSPLAFSTCTSHAGTTMEFQRWVSEDGTFQLRHSGYCVTALRGDDADIVDGDAFGLWSCDYKYEAFQNFGSSNFPYKEELYLEAPTGFCLTMSEDATAVAEPCSESANQEFYVQQQVPVRPTHKPHSAPTPRPVPRPSSHKYPNGHSCSKDSECKSGDCHKHDGPFKNKCKESSPVPSPTKKPTSSPPPNCGRKCSDDKDCQIGGFLQYPKCYVNGGTRCEGYCGP